MRIGISSFAYRWSIGRPYYRPKKAMSLLDFIGRAIDLDAASAMICNNFELQKTDDSILFGVRAKAESSEMQLSTGARGTSVDYFSAILKSTKKLNAQVMRIVTDIDRSVPQEGVEAQIQSTIEYLKKLLIEARKARIQLALENYAGIHVKEILRIIRYFDDPLLGACIDTANSVPLMENPLNVVKELARYAKAIHLKDFRIREDKRGSVICGTCLGDGIVDLKAVLQLVNMHRIGRQIFLELYIDRTESEEETMRLEDECVVRSMEYAKRNL